MHATLYVHLVEDHLPLIDIPFPKFVTTFSLQICFRAETLDKIVHLFIHMFPRFKSTFGRV